MRVILISATTQMTENLCCQKKGYLICNLEQTGCLETPFKQVTGDTVTGELTAVVFSYILILTRSNPTSVTSSRVTCSPASFSSLYCHHLAESWYCNSVGC